MYLKRGYFELVQNEKVVGYRVVTVDISTQDPSTWADNYEDGVFVDMWDTECVDLFAEYGGISDSEWFFGQLEVLQDRDEEGNEWLVVEGENVLEVPCISMPVPLKKILSRVMSREERIQTIGLCEGDTQ